MKVKAIDIARKLNISKASVSLALNGKPGVSDQTRMQVFKCLEELQNSTEQQVIIPKKEKLSIKIIVVSEDFGNGKNAEMDLWTNVIHIFTLEAKKHGYSIGIVYAEKNVQDINRAISECNSSSTAGVILFATDMRPEDFTHFKKIKKPMVIYDNDFDNDNHCIVADNAIGVSEAVDYLVQHGCRKIYYLAHKQDKYNFEERRRGFCEGMRRNGLEFREDLILKSGGNIDSVAEWFEKYLLGHMLPDAFIMENYQISIGVLKVLQKLKVQVPDALSLLGVDELPELLGVGCKVTTVKIAHEERAVMAMNLLVQDIKDKNSTKMKVMSRCVLKEGNSVKTFNE